MGVDRVEDLDEFDPRAPGVDADPHAMYRQLRSRCPVAHTSAFGGFWMVTRMTDIERVASDAATFSSAHGIIVPRNRASGRRPPLHFDPPEHTIFRTALNPAFRKDRLARLEPIVRDRATEVAAQLAGAGSGDGYAGFASPLCATSVGHLLNLPKGLLEPMTDHAARFEHAQFVFDAEQVEAENLILYDLSRRVVEERVADPQDPREDVVSGLLAIAPEQLTFMTEDGSPPDREQMHEIVAGSVRQLVVAGHGAPALVLANSIRHLAIDGDLQRRVRADRTILPPLTEELLRLHTPNQGFARTVVRATEIGGRDLSVGSVVVIPYTSANRDETVFDRPDEVVIGRRERHLAFGFGVHVCPGSHLGRLQTIVALDALLDATDWFELDGEPRFAPFPVHGPMELPLRTS